VTIRTALPDAPIPQRGLKSTITRHQISVQMHGGCGDNPIRHVWDGNAGYLLDSLGHCCIQWRNDHASHRISESIFQTLQRGKRQPTWLYQVNDLDQLDRGDENTLTVFLFGCND
jgi:hypothetical protein